MPSTSEKQRRFFGAVLGYMRNRSEKVSASVKKAAKGVTPKQAKDFAGSVKEASAGTHDRRLFGVMRDALKVMTGRSPR